MLHKKNRNKNYKNGVSALIGLLIFFVCACVAAVIVSSASAASGKIVSLREQENSYLLVKSTMNDISDRLKNTDFIFTKADDTFNVTAKQNGITVGSNEQKEGIMPLITAGLTDVFKSSETYTTELKISFAIGDASYIAEGMIVVDTGYNIKIWVRSIRPSAYTSEDAYRLAKAYSTVICFDCAGTDITKDEKGDLEEFSIYYGNGHIAAEESITDEE